MPALHLLFLAIPMDPVALCAMTDFSSDTDPKTLDVAALENIIASNPDCMPAHFLRGYAELADDSRNLDAAIKHLERALQLAPENGDTLILLGQVYLIRAGEESSLGDAGTGKEYLEAAVKFDPENLDARAILADFHRAAPWIAGGDIDVAYEQAEEIRKRDPLRGDIEMAQTLIADGEEEEGLALARALLAKHPDHDALAVQYAVLMHEREDFAEAHRVLLAATRAEDANLNALYQLGRTSALSGQFIDDARSALQRYIARGETGENVPIDAAAAWWRLGMVEEHGENFDAARAVYERALEINPDSEEAAEALADLKNVIPAQSSPQE